MGRKWWVKGDQGNIVKCKDGQRQGMYEDAIIRAHVSACLIKIAAIKDHLWKIHNCIFLNI